jgi:hypothetical protein
MNDSATPDVTADDAARALADIDLVTARVRQSRIYLLTSSALILWGPLIALGYAVTQFWPSKAMLIWPVCHLTGLALTTRLALRTPGERSRRNTLTVVSGLLILIAFGLVWSVVLGRMGPREMSAFWPMLFMLPYMLAGLWLGRVFVALGLGISALALAGYFWAGTWFDLYMAVINGGGLLLCGLWMRRA